LTFFIISCCGLWLTTVRLLAITVGIRIGCLVLQSFDEAIEYDGENCSEQWTKPVNPMVAIKGVQDNVRTKRAGWIERPAGEENTYSR
jgi:hypothetical protein